MQGVPVNSFTSSSNRYRNIWTALVIAGLTILAYEGVARAGKVRPGAGTSQGQANAVKLEILAFGPKRFKALMVGSSLTANVNGILVANHTVNVGLGANNATTPLIVAERANVRPEIVFIEIGQPLLKGVDEVAIDHLFNPVTHGLLGNVKSLRQAYQPFNVATSAVLGKSNRAERKISPSLRRETIAMKLENNRDPLTADEGKALDDAFNVIDHAISILTERGSVVALHRIPGEPAVEATPKVRDLMARAYWRFPSSRYRWVPEMSYTGWRTNDAVHIVPEDADRYARHLHAYVSRVLR